MQKMQCPVCLTEVEHGNLTYPFNCEGAVVHGVCHPCHQNLSCREMLRCPLCRAHSSTPPPRDERSEPRVLPYNGPLQNTSLQRTARLANELFNMPHISTRDFRMLLGRE